MKPIYILIILVGLSQFNQAHQTIYSSVGCEYSYGSINHASYTNEQVDGSNTIRNELNFLIQGFFYGLLFMILFYNLFLYISLKDKSYLFYVGYVLFTIIFMLHDYGYLERFFISDSPILVKSFFISKHIAYIFYLALMRYFISPVENYKLFDRAVAVILYMLMALTPVSLIVVYISFNAFVTLATIMSYVFIPIIITLLIIMLVKGEKLERYFVFGSILLFMGAAFLIAGISLGYQAEFLIYGLQLGIVLQVFLFSAGLSYRYRLVTQESIRFKYEALKTQIDPHFFFNSLSVLSGLIYKDVKLAAKYVSQLSKVYRNVLDKNVESLVTLANELQLLESYMFLINIRFGDNITIKIDLSAKSREGTFIPPNTLQLLMENAIKHNKCSKEEPLIITIAENESSIIVKNNLNERALLNESSGIGLENIKSRFNLLKDKKITINNNGEYFEVILPKYNAKDYASINI